MTIFLLMGIKGFISIVRSKVIELLNDNRETEKMPKINCLLIYCNCIFRYDCIWIYT